MEPEIIIFFGTVVFCFLVCNCFCKNQNNQIHSERNLIGIRIDVENNQNILVEENQNLSNEENQILEDALNISRETYKKEFNENLNKLEIILLNSEIFAEFVGFNIRSFPLNDTINMKNNKEYKDKNFYYYNLFKRLNKKYKSFDKYI